MSPDSGQRGRPIVFSACSGAGKTTIIREVMKQMDDLAFSISSTTRSQRNGEENGVDYDFLTHEQFQQAIDDGDFIEYEDVHGQLYGTRKSRVKPLLDAGKDVVFDLDVLGGMSMKRLFPETFLLYIDVLDREILRSRLLARGREDREEIEVRLARYDLEREMADQFDRIIVNDDLKTAVDDTIAVIRELRG
ncbi:MAG TPA: guanylate kinase [Bacteroidetes bacterium]|nr:guanylate kinase [Bacteroidota bacterium]HEX03691.1 guanylate kinase [Bacteroidota bacterium]